MTIQYLSRTKFAERIGVKPSALSRYKLPEPDAMIGTVRGWLPKTIDEWNAQRPGRGNWKQGASGATIVAVYADKVRPVKPRPESFSPGNQRSVPGETAGDTIHTLEV